MLVIDRSCRHPFETPNAKEQATSRLRHTDVRTHPLQDMWEKEMNPAEEERSKVKARWIQGELRAFKVSVIKVKGII